MKKPPKLDAELFQKQLQGKSRALLLTCRSQGGTAVECVVKIDARLDRPPAEHLCEWLAAALAAQLGITVPIAYRINLSLDFANSISEAPVRKDVAASVGATAFGSHLLSGHTQWLTDGAVPAELREKAWELLAFDILIHNVDRRRSNPNVLHRRDEVVAIDHAEAFSFTVPIIGGAPPEADPLVRVVEQHVFRWALRGKEPQLDRFRAALAGLSDGILGEIADATPREWQQGAAAGLMQRIMRVMSKRRDLVDRWLPMVEHVVVS
jgi:hypothetical protein